MIFYQTFHRALDDRTQPDTHFAGSFGQYRLVIESHGADKVYLAFTVVFVLHHVTFEECLEAVRYQRAYAGFVQVLCKEWREACQKTVGERLAVYTVDDIGGCQVELREELLLQFGGIWFFRISPTNSLPNTAPLPSSPRMNPSGDTLDTICLPS